MGAAWDVAFKLIAKYGPKIEKDANERTVDLIHSGIEMIAPCF